MLVNEYGKPLPFLWPSGLVLIGQSAVDATALWVAALITAMVANTWLLS